MVKIDKLDNALTVVSEKTTYVRSVSIGVFVKNGSMHESADVTGISHFIEHMLFKGTNKRSARDIAVAVDSVGANLNAYTTKEYTCYHIKILDTHTDLALDILYDMIFNSKLSKTDVDTERNVIFEEIAMYEDAPEELVHDMLLEAAWTDGCGVGAPTLGTHESLEKIDSGVLKTYMQKTYVPKNMVICAAGNLPDDFVLKVKQTFGQIKNTPSGNDFKFQQYKNNILIKKKDIEQVHFCLGFEAFGGDDEKNYALLAYNNILGSSMSSDLFQKIREEKGLVYSVFSYLSSFVPMGVSVVSASMHPKNLEKVLCLVYDEINKAKKNHVNESRLKQAKEQLKGNYIIGLENVSARMQSMGRSYLLYNKVRTPEQVIKKIDGVTADKTNDVIDEVFDFNKICASAIGSGDALKTEIFRMQK